MVKDLKLHVGMIPDGNRRWARQRGLPIWMGHKAGASALEKILKYGVLRGVYMFSVYSLSLENLKRTREELKQIFRIQAEYFERFAEDEVVHKEGVKARVLGEMHLLPSFLLQAAERMMRATEGYSNHFVNFLMPYGGQQEIVKAVKLSSISLPPFGPLTTINPKSALESNLYVRFPVDLIIRTAERRLSNFLLYQSAYAEVFFISKFWPDFTEGDLELCLSEFLKRERTFGK